MILTKKRTFLVEVLRPRGWRGLIAHWFLSTQNFVKVSETTPKAGMLPATLGIEDELILNVDLNFPISNDWLIKQDGG